MIVFVKLPLAMLNEYFSLYLISEVTEYNRANLQAVKQRKQKTKRTNAVTVHSHKYVDIDDIFPW